MVGLGHRGGPIGGNLSFTFGSSSVHGAAGHWGAPDTGWGTVPTANAWHHLVYVYGDGGATDFKLYADGVLTNSDTFSLNTNSTAGTFVNLGAQNSDSSGTLFSGEQYTGYLANVRVHSGALTGTEVLNNFNEGIVAVIPEPHALVLTVLGLVSLIGLGLRRKR